MSTDFPTTAEITADALRALKATGVDTDAMAGGREVRTPITGEVIFSVRSHADDDVDAAIAEAAEAFTVWREVPAPVRGRLVKRWGELLTEHKEDLATLVTAEVGKITSEALGEVQEMIDITDLAVGQSRQLFRQDDALGAAGSPFDGDLAPAGRRWNHLRLQLPRGGL
jgi:aldehyde dehydrogenase (NAD+)